MKVAILGTRGIPNNYGGFEQCAEYLSVGLVSKGHEVIVYNPEFHPYNSDNYKGVKIIKKASPRNIVGKAAANFIYDYLCLKDAVNRDIDIILELGLITSSLGIIFCNHKGKVITTNLDGLEWKRSKWNNVVQFITKALEKYGVRYSDYLVADNIGIQKYILKKYNKNSAFIPYGAEVFKSPNKKLLKEYNLSPYNYLLTIARLEPENNLEMMFDAYVAAKRNIPYVVIGNHLTNYGDYLKDKYRNLGIIFLGGIFDKNHLDNLRMFAKYYLHGHSVGGTNPSLLEAMAAGAFILGHDNQFNKSVVNNEAYYFSTVKQLTSLLKKKSILDSRHMFTNINIEKIKKTYNWNNIIDQYEKYFIKILQEYNLNHK